MAIELISYEQFNTNCNGDHSITVPTDCELIVITNAYYLDNNSKMTFATIDDGVEDFTEGANLTASSNVNGSASIFYLANPSTGSQTLTTTHANGDSVDDRAATNVLYFKGVDTTSPIRDSDTAIGSSPYSTAQTITSASMSCNNGDYGLVTGFSYQANPDSAPSGSGQTEIIDEYYGSSSFRNSVGYKNITSTGTTTMQQYGVYPSLAAIIIAVAAGGATTIEPSISDTATATEDVTILLKQLNIDVNDTVSLTEALD